MGSTKVMITPRKMNVIHCISKSNPDCIDREDYFACFRLNIYPVTDHSFIFHLTFYANKIHC